MPQKWIFFDDEVIFELDELDDDEKADEDDKIGIYWNTDLPQEGGYRDELRKSSKSMFLDFSEFEIGHSIFCGMTEIQIFRKMNGI